MHEREMRGVDEILDRPKGIGAEWIGPGVEDAEGGVAGFRKGRNVVALNSRRTRGSSPLGSAPKQNQ
jgi:hypothetical protein